MGEVGAFGVASLMGARVYLHPDSHFFIIIFIFMTFYDFSDNDDDF